MLLPPLSAGRLPRARRPSPCAMRATVTVSRSSFLVHLRRITGGLSVMEMRLTTGPLQALYTHWDLQLRCVFSCCVFRFQPAPIQGLKLLLFRALNSIFSGRSVADDLSPCGHVLAADLRLEEYINLFCRF